MAARPTRRLLAIHRWAGLFLSLNVLIFSVTGLLLIFHEEIDSLLGNDGAEESGPVESGDLTRTAEAMRRAHPGEHLIYLSADPEHEPLGYVGFASGSRSSADAKYYQVNLATGAPVGDEDFEQTFTGVVLHLHADLLAGPPGALLVGAIGLSLMVLIVTGVLVYGPMMRRYSFGMLRANKSRRNFWADVHKLVGAATFGWLAIVTLTGILLSTGSLLINHYATTELRELSKGYQDEEVVTDLVHLEAAVAASEKKSGRKFLVVMMPGSDLSSPRHYAVLLGGTQGFDQRMLTIALVDATDTTQVQHHEFPWYLQALLVSEPLHFGDYGGLPLRLLWAFFTLALIGLSATGIYTFLTSRRTDRSRVLSTIPSTAEAAE